MDVDPTQLGLDQGLGVLLLWEIHHARSAIEQLARALAPAPPEPARPVPAWLERLGRRAPLAALLAVAALGILRGVTYGDG
jgi:hypothetical protein